MLDLNAMIPEILEFIMRITTGFQAKRGEDILEKPTEKISEFLKKRLGKDELERIKGLTAPDAKRRLEELVKDKNLVKEVHTFYVIYKYLEKLTADSVFLRMSDFRRGEGLPLDQMYVKLRIVEEDDEECYYRVKKRLEKILERNERPFKRIDPNDIMDMDKGLVCILGLPGAGKTTLCKYFCWKTLKGEYTKKGLPIYVELREVEEKEDLVTSALYSKLKRHFTKEEIEEAVATIKHNTELFSPLFIFDGLDEVRVDYEFISESIKNCADSSLCVVTSRRSGFIYMQHDRTYEVLPLEWKEKKGFVENYFTYISEENKIGSFLQILEKREYASLSKNPMLLSILCALASDEEDVGNLPSRKSGLYRKIVVKMNEWHKSKGGEGLSQEEIRNLEDVALNLFRNKRPKLLFEEGIDENVLDRAARIGILCKWDESRYSFLHSTLQEYFAACSLKSLRKEEWKEIIREKKSVFAWEEIIQLFASILNEEKEYEELQILLSIVLESPDILYLNYTLAIRCLGKIDIDVVSEFSEVLENIMRKLEECVCKNSFLRAFIYLGDKAVDPLLDLLQRTDDDGLKWGISCVFGEIGDPGTVDPLLDLLQRTDDGYLKESILNALGRIGDPRATDCLLDFLQRTDDGYLKESILIALGKIGDPGTVDPLLDLLQRTDDGYLKWRISCVLGEIEDKAVDPLLDLLQRTDDDDLKWGIYCALCRVGNRAVDPLLDLLQRTDDNLKWEISFVFGKIGDPRATGYLLDLFQRTDDNYRKNEILEALGKIGDPRAADPLVNSLQRTDDDDLKVSILDALSRIGDPRATDYLLDLFQRTDDNDLKVSILDALSRIGDRAVDCLLDLLQKTDDDCLEWGISCIFGKMGDPRATGYLLDLLQRTDDDDLKEGILDALGEIRDPRAVDPLVDLLQRTDDDYLKYDFLDALGKIGDPRAADPLIDLLQGTDDDDLKWAIYCTLGKIGDPRSVGPLLDLFQRTDDDYLKKSISHVLENSNPILLYSFMKNQLLQNVILDVLCYFSTKYNIRFFKDKIVLSEGEVLYIKPERHKEQSMKKLDKVLKS